MNPRICIWLLLSLVFSLPLTAQLDTSCYQINLQKGLKAYKNGRYDLAINSYIYARWCPESESNTEVDRLIKQTLSTWVDSLNIARKKVEANLEIARQQRNRAENEKNRADQLRKIADQQRDTAERNYLLFYGYFVADEAIKDLKNNQPLKGLYKAFHAYDTLRQTPGIPVPPSVIQAFGDAVFQNFGKELKPAHEGGIIDIGFSPDGRHFYTIGRDSKLRLWQLQARSSGYIPSLDIQEVHLLSDIQKETAPFIVSADFNAADDRILFRDKLQSPGHRSLIDAPIVDLEKKDGEFVTHAKWLPDGRILLAYRNEENGRGKVVVHNGNSPSSKVVLEDFTPIRDIIVSDDGSHVLVRSAKSLYYWPSDREEDRKTLDAYTDNTLIYTAAISADGRRVVAGNSLKEVKLWEDGQYRQKLPVAPNAAFALQLSAGGQLVLIGYRNGIVQSWTDDPGQSQLQTYQPAGKVVDQLALNRSVDPSHFLSVSLDSTLRLMDAGGNDLWQYKHQGRITAADFSPTQDTLLVSSSLDQTSKLWRYNGQLIMDMNLGSGVVKTRFTPDGQYLLSGTEVGTLYFTPTPEFFFQKLSILAQKGKINTRAVKAEVNENLDQLLGKEEMENRE